MCILNPTLTVSNAGICILVFICFFWTFSYFSKACKNHPNYNTGIMYGVDSLNKNHQSKKTSSLYIILKVSVFKIRDIKLNQVARTGGSAIITEFLDLQNLKCKPFVNGAKSFFYLWPDVPPLNFSQESTSVEHFPN